MPSYLSFGRGVNALRALASRTQRMPKAPFAIGLALAVVALGAVIDMVPEVDARTGEVEELETPPDSGTYGYTTEEAEVEIVEYGFSAVTVDGEGWILVGVVLRNPYDKPLYAGGLSVTGVAEDGNPIRAEDFWADSIPPESTVQVGYAMRGNATDIPLDGLRVEALGDGYVEIVSGDAEWHREITLPEVEVLGLEPLTSPSGYRVRYRVDPDTESRALSMVFRDGEGRLLGGFPVTANPFDLHVRFSARDFPTEASARYMDVPETWIPEGADLDAIAIGPTAFPG